MNAFFGLLLFAFAPLLSVAGQSYGDGGGLRYGCGYMPMNAKPPLPAPIPPTSAPFPCIYSNNTEVQTWVNGGEDVVFHLYYNELHNTCAWPITQHFIYVKPLASIQQYWNVEIYANDSTDDIGEGTGVFMLPDWARTWGVAAGQTMDFGWIAEGEVTFSDSPV